MVRSTKEKRYEDLTNLIKAIRNHRKIKDMASLLQSFEDLTRAYQKALPVIMKEENGVTPRFYVRALAECEDFINEVWEDREGRKNLSKNNSKALGQLRQKFRKYVKDFESDLAKFRESPDEEDEPEEEKVEEASEESEDEQQPAPKAVTFKKEEKKAPKDADDSDDSIDWGSDSDSDSDSSEEETQYVNIRERFLKKTTEKEEKDDEEKKKKKKEKDSKPRRRREDTDEEGEWETVTKGSSTTAEKPKMFAKDAEINIPLVLDKLNEVGITRWIQRPPVCRRERYI